MCGIAAILLKPDSELCSNPRTIKDDLDAMICVTRHRGPDSDGMYINEKIVGLGMNRLTIVGGQSGKQPIWNEDHSVVVVCNGEIYNYHSLRLELEMDGHTFSTSSDVEVIVHLYEQYKEDCVKHLEGIFAFTLWDLSKKKFFSARDRLGVKPLYFTVTKERYIFASEIRALLIHKDVEKNIDNGGFSQFHLFRFVPGDRTIISGIHKLRPGECITIDNKYALVRSFYWSPVTVMKERKINTPYKKKVRDLREKLLNAVLSQEVSGVKSGILLSGGLDSSALLAMHHHLLGTVPGAFTVGFTTPRQYTQLSEFNEIESAADVAKQFGASHVSECYTPLQVLSCLPDIIKALDEPIADPTAIPLWFATRLAHQSGVKVLFSGEGLDELFNGYEVYRQIYWLQMLKLFPRMARRLALLFVNQFNLPGAGILKKSITSVSDWYQGVGGTFKSYELEAILANGQEGKFNNSSALAYAREILEPVQHQSALVQMTLFDLMAWLPENTLAKSDKISMAHSVELRVPFLDYHIVEFALKMDKRDKLRGKTGKWIVRDALAHIVSEKVIRQKKAGFPIPLTSWMFNEWKDFVLDTLRSESAVTRCIYRAEEIESLFKVPVNGRRRAARLLWTLLCFEIWLKQVYYPTLRPNLDMVREPLIV